ncbi:MAG: Polymer-forming cytoskeletal [candidate division WS2 bacterium ADurb.Bin280]|uniref:Polymer-forming cytoskeletal n=1 Tax=candidate division WS2 bacterium ADurb.Bin280 TaxID=1852829 RepID=A0A1V5SF16_9BACT|nr:MAG: Polymer-forming cytoskeletal [candidate division WS2 bacterium ADurb.Bin280]
MKQQEVGTIVGSSVHLTGSIKDSSDIVIFGSVDGEVSSEQKIVIEEPAKVKGPITGNEVIVSGTVNGTIIAKERLELSPTGAIKGNIETQSLLIHSGAIFIGKCSMPDKKGGIEGESVVKEDFETEIEDEKLLEEKEEVEEEKKER